MPKSPNKTKTGIVKKRVKPREKKGPKLKAPKKKVKKKTKKKTKPKIPTIEGDKPKRGPGRPRLYTDEQRHERQKARSAKYLTQQSKSGRDIGELDTDGINWELRHACKRNLKLFSETYLPNIFYLGWSNDQLKCVAKAEKVVMDGGTFALAMPRGGGKTAICRSTILWATAYGHRRFPYFVGSTQPMAIQTLGAIKTYWYRSQLLRRDFPEIGWPIYKLENRFHMARGQLYNGEPTHVEWGSESVQFPCLLLPEEVAAEYRKHDPDTVKYLAEYDAWIPKTAGIMINTAGIDGTIRGEAEIHPITLEQPRPDIVLLDDIQKDQKADSPASCEKMIRLVDGAIAGLSGPGQHIAGLMPCTVIREGDVADTYLSHSEKPEWQGERCAMVIKWPKGMTNSQVSLETEAGKKWNKYDELRRLSLTRHGDLRLATEYYGKPENRKVMDEGFECSWPDRYTKKHQNKHFIELSAQQHAMNLRLKAPASFSSEFQNVGRKLVEEGIIAITSDQLRKKVIDYKRGEVPPDCQHLVGFVDIQTEMLFYGVLGVNSEFTGVITDYGGLPDINSRYFTRAQTYSWSLLTKMFFDKYPEHRDKATVTSAGRIRAPLEAKIYHALSVYIPMLLNRVYTRKDEHGTPMRISKLAIDTRWGQASDATKRYIKESGFQNLVPYYGNPIPPTNKQIEEYDLKKGWYFEHQAHPTIKEAKWYVKPSTEGLFYMNADVNRLKDFLFERLGSPLGARGSIALYNDTEEVHEMVSDQICNPEYPELVSARGLDKNMWMQREDVPDNDYLDVFTGCMAMASLDGACLVTGGESIVRPQKVTERWKRNR